MKSSIAHAMKMNVSDIIGEQKRFWKWFQGDDPRFNPENGIAIPWRGKISRLGMKGVLIMPEGFNVKVFLMALQRHGLEVESFLEARDIDHIAKREEVRRTYLVWNRGGARPEHLAVSAAGFKKNGPATRGLRSMDLTERLAFGAMYFKEHLRWPDEGFETICASSETYFGNIPSVGVKNGKLFINVSHPERKDSHAGIREVFGLFE